MKNFKNLFSKNEKSVNKIETVYGDVDASIDIVSQYLHDIEEDLLKLEIISRLSDDTYLESKILYYKEKLQSLKNEYELENYLAMIKLISLAINTRSNMAKFRFARHVVPSQISLIKLIVMSRRG